MPTAIQSPTTMKLSKVNQPNSAGPRNTQWTRGVTHLLTAAYDIRRNDAADINSQVENHMSTQNNHIIGRTILTIIIATLFGWGNYLFKIYSSNILAPHLSQGQLDPTDSGFMISDVARWFNGANGIPWIGVIGFLIILGIWAGPLKRLFAGAKEALALLMVFFIAVSTSHAYYDTKEAEEVYTIPTNATAFLVKMVGDNVTDNKKFDSAAYLEQGKVPMKRIQIHHTQLHTNWMSANVYIPSEQIVVATREPFVRSWVDGKKGTAQEDQGMDVETNEGINVNCGLVVRAHIEPKDMALYSFTWGIDTRNTYQPDRGHPEYASVVFVRQLADVMDNTARYDVHGILFNEVSRYGLMEGEQHKMEIIKEVEKQSKAAYITTGITIDSVSWAKPWDYAPEMQKAINEKFIAAQNAQAAKDWMASLPVEMTRAEIAIKNAFATAAAKWDGHLSLPSFLFISDALANQLGGFFKSPLPQAPEPKK